MIIPRGRRVPVVQHGIERHLVGDVYFPAIPGQHTECCRHSPACTLTSDHDLIGADAELLRMLLQIQQGCVAVVQRVSGTDVMFDIYNECLGVSVITVILPGWYQGMSPDERKKPLNSLKLAAIETHVADARTCCLNPASTTHRQMTDEQLAAAGIPAGLIRLSCGLENAQDLMDDLSQALEKI